MRKLLILPLLFALACEPDGVPVPPPVDDPAVVVPVPADTFHPRHNDPAKKGKPVDLSASQVPDELEPAPSDFCHQGEACDVAGDPVLARKVDPTRSTFVMQPDAKLFVPGDRVKFTLCAKDSDGNPVVGGLPGIVVVKQTRRQFAGDGTTLTGGQGCVVVEGIFAEEDQIGDPSTPEPDSGSYLVNGYIGGRLLNTVKVLHDTW